VVTASFAAAITRTVRVVWVDAVDLSENVVQGRPIKSDHRTTRSSDTVPVKGLCGCVADVDVALDQMIAVLVAAAVRRSIRIVRVDAVDLA